MTFGAMNHLSIQICQDAADATAKGFFYRDGFTAVEIEKVVVVRNGTQEGKSTVDLILTDSKGNKYVTLVTGSLLKSIPC